MRSNAPRLLAVERIPPGTRTLSSARDVLFSVVGKLFGGSCIGFVTDCASLTKCTAAECKVPASLTRR